MKKDVVLTLWVLSFVMMVLIANPDNIGFWVTLVVFSLASIYIEKHSERLEREE